jgi:predicted ATPase/DNA-binding CsgD family transcriptional regulator/DNA-binding XRE family transcriptional regulator/predicted negative regulator of RcsB-dependent stress response
VSEPARADSVGERLRILRHGLGLSQEQLARRLGVSFVTVNRWESGKTQISAKAAAALADLEASPADGEGTGLPVARSSFVGRERELDELARLLRQSRLVTLIGPGGAGKSRLAAEALSQRDISDADVVFVALEQIRHPRTIASALASRLQVHDQQGTPLIQALRSALAAGPKKLLLLDGAERLADQVAELAGELLGSVPELRIVVTSRVVLGVPGEVCWTVPPLACPSVAAGATDIASSDAVQLFIARASERLPDFRAADVAPHAIAELCRRLDGLPLAIELIAGWVGTLSIREILQQRAVLLDSEPVTGAGRRLADVMQVSYDLLTAEQRQRLCMLSVIAGPFRMAEAQAVLGVDAPTAIATVRALVDSSWLVVTRGAERNLFSLLETIATFTGLQLEKNGDGPAARRRHALHFAGVAVESEQGLAGPDAASWAARLEAAVADLDLTMHWAHEHHDVDLGLNVSSALWRWWLSSGRLAVGRGWLARFLALAGDRQDEVTGRAYCAAAVLAAENGDYREAVRQAELAMTIFGPLQEKPRMTLAATVIGSANRYLGHHEEARRGFERAMELRAELGDRRGMTAAMNNLALLELDDGNLDRALELFEEALAIKREFGEQRSIAIGLANLADVLIRTGQWDRAETVLAEGARLAGANPQLIGTIACNQGALATHRRDWPLAAERFAAAIAASQAGGHPHDVIQAMIGLGRVHARSGDHDAAFERLRAARALAAKLGNPQRLAEAEAALAEVSGPDVAGQAPLAPAIPSAPATGPSATATGRAAAVRPGNLTSRQAEVLALLAAGLSNKQIAAELYLSTATVERHLATVYRNLGLGGRVDAARFALENGLGGQLSPAR